MSEPLSPIEIERKMSECIEALEACTDDLKKYACEAAETNHAYRKAQARAWLSARTDPNLKTDRLKEAWVVSETGSEMWKRDMAEAAYDSQKSLFRSLQTQSEILRSLARSSRDLVDSWHGRS